MEAPQHDDEEVFIAVPMRFAREAKAFIEGLKTASPSGGIPEDGSTEAPTGWTEQQVRDVAQTSGYTDLLTFLDVLAVSPGKWCKKRDIEESQNLNPTRIRTELSGLTRYFNKRNKQEHWFFQVGRVDGEMAYLMEPKEAAWWVAARSTSTTAAKGH